MRLLKSAFLLAYRKWTCFKVTRPYLVYEECNALAKSGSCVLKHFIACILRFFESQGRTVVALCCPDEIDIDVFCKEFMRILRWKRKSTVVPTTQIANMFKPILKININIRVACMEVVTASSSVSCFDDWSSFRLDKAWMGTLGGWFGVVEEGQSNARLRGLNTWFCRVWPFSPPVSFNWRR